jgi:hypothetical protein
MSFYLSDKQLREWADKTLKKYLDPHEYPAIFAALRSPKRSEGLSRVEIGLLRLLLVDFRPERSQAEERLYAESNAIKIPELADILHCNASTVRRAKERLNRLVKEGARRQTEARRHGLLMFHDMGVCIRATFWDALRAREYSERQGNAQLEVHSSNISLSDEKRHEVKVSQELVSTFSRLSPAEQERILRMAHAPMT